MGDQGSGKEEYNKLFIELDTDQDGKLDSLDCKVITEPELEKSMLEEPHTPQYEQALQNQEALSGSYIKILRCYQDNVKVRFQINNWLKCLFFAIVMILLIGLEIGGGILIYYLVKKGLDVNGVVSLAASVAGMFTGLLVLPKIIAEYLFPKKEEEYLHDLLTIMMKNNETNTEIFKEELHRKK